MKFRFCGDLDAPEWILAEVSVLSKMSSVRMKLLVRQVLLQLLGRGINYAKIKTLTTSARIQFEPSDVKAMIAALHFILSSAAKYDVEPEVLNEELQQLGLPADISKAICKEFAPSKTALREYLASRTLSLPRVVKADWRVDYLLSSSLLQDLKAPSIRFNLHLADPAAPSDAPAKQVAFEMTAEMFRVFHNELKAVRAQMDV